MIVERRDHPARVGRIEVGSARCRRDELLLLPHRSDSQSDDIPGARISQQAFQGLDGVERNPVRRDRQYGGCRYASSCRFRFSFLGAAGADVCVLHD